MTSISDAETQRHASRSVQPHDGRAGLDRHRRGGHDGHLQRCEAIYFAIIAPKMIAETSMPLASELAIEVVPVSLLAGVAWGSMNLKRRSALIVVTMVLCTIGVAITTPALLYGVAEQIRWLPRPTQHLSGVRTLPLPRHLSYIVLAALAGLPFVSPARRDL